MTESTYCTGSPVWRNAVAKSAIAFLGITAIFAIQSAATAQLPNGTYTITPVCAAGSRLDAAGSGTSPGTATDLWSANGGSNQSWIFTNMGSGLYKIQPSYATSLALDVAGWGTSNGTAIDMWTDNGQNNQRWQLSSNGDGTYQIIPAIATGSRLDVSGSSNANGTKIDIWSSNGSNGQSWMINRATSSASGSNWMGAVPDHIYLSQLTIPGTHDADALNEPVSGTAKCQNLNIASQLSAGVRFLDVRCCEQNNTFYIYHGSYNESDTFSNVVSQVTSFLSNNPSETVIMSVKEENPSGESGNTESFEQCFDSYVNQNSSVWYLSSSFPTLNTVRGKIVLLRRFGASNLPLGIDGSNWPDNTTFTVNSLVVEDNYQVSDDGTKWSQILNNWNSSLPGSPWYLYITFASGVQSGAFGIPNIPAVSNTINPDLANYFSSATRGMFGVIPMDFADSSHASQMYNTDLNMSGSIPYAVYKVVNANSGQLLDVYGNSGNAGTSIDQYPDVGGLNQRWTFQSYGNGNYAIRALSDGFALDDPGSSTSSGVQMDQWNLNSQNNQMWQAINNGDGTYRLVNQASGLALEVRGGSTSNGAAVDQAAWTGAAYQKWKILVR